MGQKINSYFSKDDRNLFIKLFGIAIIVNFIVESFSRRSILNGFAHIISHPGIFLYNTAIILLTLSVGFFIKRRTLGIFIMSGIWIGFGITDFILLCFRTTPFTAVDFSLITEAIPMIKLYLTPINIILIIAGLLIFTGIIVFAWKYAPKYKEKIPYLRNAIVVFVIFIVVLLATQIGLSTKALASTFGNIADAYENYGFAYCFVNSLVNTGISKPKDYSTETMDKIVKETVALNGEKEERNNTNIIMVQLESFFDPTYLKGVTFSSDPIPNYHKLSKEFSSGFVTVPSVGAGTANTEFEILTGMSLEFFGPGEYPYKTILKESTCESIAYNLKEEGYSTHVLHNNDGTFYGRNEVFANLGFDTFTSIEYMNPITRNAMGWAKDEILIKNIKESLESTKNKDFIYTISVQAHGKYPKSIEDDLTFATSEADKLSNEDKAEDSKEKEHSTREHKLEVEKLSKNHITLEGIKEEYAYAFEYYINQIHEVDEFVGNLVETFKNYNENTVIVFYGDHLPSLGITQEDMTNNTVFQTPYIIWSNFDMEKKDEDIYAYQLEAKVLERLGMSNGIITKFHQKNSNSENYLKELELLQYDMLYGKKEVYNEQVPYEPTNLKMGIHNIKIKDMEIKNGIVYISGEHFTEFSKAIVDGKVLETTYMDENTLCLNNVDLKKGSTVEIAQIGDDDEILSKSKAYIY